MEFDFKKFEEIQEDIRVTLIDVSWYRERYEIPETKNRIEQDKMLSKWIVSATEQIDSICEGRLSIEIPKFSFDSKQDAKELAIVQSCVGDLVEYFVLTGKAFADVDKSIQSSIPYDLKSKSADGNLEEKRLDILRKLATTRFYRTIAGSNSGGSKETTINASSLVPTSEDFKILVEYLQNYFLSNRGTNKQSGDILFGLNPKNSLDTLGSERQIIGAGHIKSNAYNQNLPREFFPSIYGYKFNGPIGNAENTDKIYFDKDYYSIKDLVDKYGLSFFGDALNQALTRQEIYNLLQASQTVWNELFVYEIDVLVNFKYNDGDKVYLGQAVSLIENNKGNNPAIAGQKEWKILTNVPFDITELVVETTKQVVEKLDPIIDSKIEALPTIDYVSEYSNQILTFNSEAEFEIFKTETKTDDTYFADVTSNKILFYAGEIKMFSNTGLFTNFITALNLVDRVDFFHLPRNHYLMTRRDDPGIVWPAANGGIINESFVQKKDLTHKHYVTPKLGRSANGGTHISQYSNVSSTDGVTTDARIHFGVDNPLPVNRLLDTYGVIAIEFKKNIER